MPPLRVVQIRWDISDVEFKSYTILSLKNKAVGDVNGEKETYSRVS